jgi:hypothetical protein
MLLTIKFRSGLVRIGFEISLILELYKKFMLFEELDLEFEFPILFICGTKIIIGIYNIFENKNDKNLGSIGV